MASAACSDEEFIKLFREIGSPQAVSEALGVSIRNVFAQKESAGTETRDRASFVLETFADHKRNARAEDLQRA
jgi:hypothetical protein